MGWLKFATVALCVWGSTSNATLQPAAAVGGERQEGLQTIQSWVAHLNRYYPEIEVGYSQQSLKDSELQIRALWELQLLEEVLRQERQLPAGHLRTLSCSNIVCGGKR
ncbi:MAG: hypothetical protein KF799_13640 [Bdellovibrionales bacterium]|nr:hypothetical protein [Bdellovibrionales bacterium]